VSVRLEVSAPVAAEPARVWTELTDWAGQRRWIPFTTVRVAGRATGIGVRAEALSGFWLGRLPVGLLDRFVVTGWTPPGDHAGELEVLHLGPYFTGEGVFRVERAPTGSLVACVEVFSLPAGRLTEPLARLTMPVMRRALATSLRGLATVSEAAG
jgi:Polyketide cyclase / dehydrase and lipid transport